MKKSDITPSVVACLIKSQFPLWAEMPITPVDQDGWDNTTYRLGTEMLVRLPSADAYSAQVDKEHRWLPYLAEHLPLPIPQPLAKGSAACGFPRAWSIYRWLPGVGATVDNVTDPVEFARCLGEFLNDLYAIPSAAGPPPGQHNFFRGASPEIYDDQTRQAVDVLEDDLDASAVMSVWETSLSSSWQGQPVWLHGDVTPSNLLVTDGRLSAVIDFGTMAVGDPACDLTMAWTFFDDLSRRMFRDAVGFDSGTWARARGWALWKALITHVEATEASQSAARVAGMSFGWRKNALSVIDEVIADHAACTR